MKLYGCASTPNPRSVKIVLAEKQIDYDMVEVDLYSGEHKQAEFLKINPSGRVPVLETDDGELLTESIAICRYLEALVPEPSLFGTNPLEIGIIEMKNSQIENDLWYQIRTSWKNSLVLEKMGYPVIPQARELSDPNVYAYYEKLDNEFASTEFLAGTKFSIADITLLTGVDFAIHNCALIPDDTRKNFWRWHAQVTDRDCVEAIK